MGAVETILYIFGVLLVVVIIAVLVRLHFIIEQQGVQISILLKHEKEGFSAYDRWVKQHNYSKLPNHLMPSDKANPGRVGNEWASANTRAQGQCFLVPESKQSGLAGHAETAAKLNITTGESVSAGNYSNTDFVRNSNYVSRGDNAVAEDQRSFNGEIISPEKATGNARSGLPDFLLSSTEGVKQSNESSKERYRLSRKQQAGLL